MTLPSPSAQASPGSIDAGTVLDVRFAGEPVHPRRPCRLHHPRPDEKRVAGLQPAANRLEGGHGPQHHHDLLLVALPRYEREPRSCSAGCLRMMDRLLAILSLSGLALIIAAPLWQ